MRPRATRRTSQPATGMRWRRYWPTTSVSTIAGGSYDAGIKRGRDAEMANLRAAADVGITLLRVRRHRRPRRAPNPHPRLGRSLAAGPGSSSARRWASLKSTHIIRSRRSSYSSSTTSTSALAELDARYLAGEAAPHAHTWSVVTRAYAALNRHELPSTTTDGWALDHRRGTSFASGEMPALLDAAWNLTTELRHSVEAVHRLE